LKNIKNISHCLRGIVVVMDTKIFISLCVLLLWGMAEAIDVESAKEQKCFNVTTTPVDPKFLAQLKTIYYPMVHRKELYRTTVDLLQVDPKDIDESTVYYDSCAHFSLKPSDEGIQILVQGFGNKQRLYKTKTILPNMEKFEFWPAEGKGYKALSHTVYTDNKSFFLAALCDDDEMSWAVGSMYPTLTKESYDMVMKLVLDLGFKKEYITKFRYDYCDLDQNNTEATTQAAA